MPADKPTGEETIETIAGTGAEEDDGTNPGGDLSNLEFKPATLTNIDPKDMILVDNAFYFSDEDAKRIRRMFVCKNPEITSTSIDKEVICEGDQVTMSFEGDINDGTVWDWYEGSCNVGGEDLENGKSYTVTATEDVSYYAVGRGGCSHDVECQIFELKISCRDFFNAFTPNGDGINDFLEIPALETYATNRVIIYNRWGQLLEQIDNYDNATVVWSGTNGDSDPVDSGTYYFTAEANGELIISGWVEVIK